MSRAAPGWERFAEGQSGRDYCIMPAIGWVPGQANPAANFNPQGCEMISIPSKAAIAVLLFVAFFAANSRAQMASDRERGYGGHQAMRGRVGRCLEPPRRARHGGMRYVEDGDYSSTTGIPSHGWKELEDHYNEIFTTFLKDAHRTDTVKSIRFLTSGHCLRGHRLANDRGQDARRQGRAQSQRTSHLDRDQAQRAVDDHDLPRIRVLNCVWRLL